MDRALQQLALDLVESWPGCAIAVQAQASGITPGDFAALREEVARLDPGITLLYCTVPRCLADGARHG